MLVTLPFVLLLLDYWPLRRFDRLLPLLREKLPLFALSVASSVVTYLAQSSGGATQDFRNVPLSYRIANMLVSYALYIYALIWPQGLAVYYPTLPTVVRSPPRSPLWPCSRRSRGSRFGPRDSALTC
jgi:hypothetical protein